ncbi:MAG: CBS domain-containing protein [Rhodospirillales bacterium]|nr:CBS domain-containing protein [Rhodospirillales bacterium]
MRQLRDIVWDHKPVVLPPSATVKEACRAMRERRVGSVVVAKEGGRLAGIFTGRDAVCRVLAAGKDPAATELSDVMTTDPATMSPDQSALDALRLMWDGGFRHLPLVKAGQVVGVVSRGDFKGFEHQQHDEERDLWENMR